MSIIDDFYLIICFIKKLMNYELMYLYTLIFFKSPYVM